MKVGATYLRETLNNQCLITATFRRADSGTLHVRKATQTEPEQLTVYNALNIDPVPGGVNKLIV